MEMENNLTKSIVYISVNTVNSKIYIGVHITDTPYKFDNYWGCGITGTSSYWFKHPKYPFQFACKKYGLDAFKRYTLFVFDTYQEALDMEKLIVNSNFLKRPDVYNVALGGGSGLVESTEIEVHQYSLTGEYIRTYRSYSEAGRENQISYQSIHSAVISKGICANSYWSETRFARLDIDNYKSSQAKQVYVYTHTGDFYKEFQSFSDCAKSLEVNLSGVQKAIKYNIKCKGFYISDSKLERYPIKSYTRNRNASIYQYSSKGEFLKEYKNASEVRTSLNKPLTRLSSHIMDQTLYEGYYWSYEKLDTFTVKSGAKKQIGQYTLTGELVKVWDSYRECVNTFSNLRYVLNGSRESTKGFTFKYIENKL